jgi:trimethylamine:corrinoid methyltransferase-like protein
MGGTAPMTMAGIVLLSNVENLAGNIIAQVLNPGTPMIFLGHKISIDMATGNTLQSTVENFIAAGAHAEFVKERYGIPFHTWGSGSDSWLPDGQSMIERSFLGLLTSMGGTDVLGGLGQLGCDCSISPAQLVVDNDIIGMIRKIRRGIQVDDDSLAWEIIQEVGPGGQFLDQTHTLQHCREILSPTTFNRKSKAEWSAQGQKDIVNNAEDVVDHVKEAHDVPPLPVDILKELSSIVKRADKKLI